MRCGIISSCQSSATIEIVKALLVLSPSHVRSAIARTELYFFTTITTTTTTIAAAAITTTVLCVNMCIHVGQGGTSRVLIQIQFTDWPDHGVPQHAVSLLSIRHTVRSLLAHDQYVLVHCRYRRLYNTALNVTDLTTNFCQKFGLFHQQATICTQLLAVKLIANSHLRRNSTQLLVSVNWP